MGRAPCCDKANVKKGPWSPEEDSKLKDYIDNFGTGGSWISLPQKAGLKRCGKSCRLRWLNYLRPNIKHGEFSDEEDRIILNLFATIGSRWSIIASQLPGRTDNDIKNYWNTKFKKKLIAMMVPPLPCHHLKPSPIQLPSSPTTHTYQNLLSQPSLSFLRDNKFNSCPFYPPNNTDFLTSLSLPQNLLLSDPIGSFQPQEANLVTPIQTHELGTSSSMKLLDQSSLMFSDPIKQERVDFQSPISNGFDQSHNQWSSHNNNALVVDYDDIEDVKRLIGSSNSEESGNSNFFFGNFF